MNNRRLGNAFEQMLAEDLKEHGFWVHLLTQNQAGQPADLIAARNGRAYLIDCKVCTSKGFRLSRIEPNQETAMTAWGRSGNGDGWFALCMGDMTEGCDIYMVGLGQLLDLRERNWIAVPNAVIHEIGLDHIQWIEREKERGWRHDGAEDMSKSKDGLCKHHDSWKVHGSF